MFNHVTGKAPVCSHDFTMRDVSGLYGTNALLTLSFGILVSCQNRLK